MRHVAANVLTLLVVLMAIATGAIQAGKADYAAPGPARTDRIVSIASGTTMDEAADLLAEAGVLAERTVWGVLPGVTLFKLGARYTGQTTALKAGEYRIPAQASMARVMELVTSGESIQFPVTVPEGLTSWEVVALLEESDVLTGEIAERPAEGSLAPDTYFVDRGTSREALIRRMQERQERILAEAWENRATDLPLDTPEDALILASIVEKETGLAAERRVVASVFINRLRRGMRLQTDPTVVYGAIGGEGALNRPPTAPELRTPGPYNTYVIRGLPPTPIANPGRAAIEATLRPEDTSYLFFVANGEGGHTFSETLVEHNAAVRRWRRFRSARPAPE